jgi:hypothetical protein
MQNGNAIVSHNKRALVYEGPNSQTAMNFGGVRGHKYADIDDFISSGGNLRRLDADNLADNLDKIIRGDIDVMLMPKSGALFTISKCEFQNDFYISPKSHSNYERSSLIINHNS